MDKDIALLLIGSVLTMAGSILAHFLSLHADKVRRERDAEEEKAKNKTAALQQLYYDVLMMSKEERAEHRDKILKSLKEDKK